MKWGAIISRTLKKGIIYMTSKNKILHRSLYGLYVFIYLPWFFALEHVNTIDSPGMHILNTSFDELIPFCEYFIIPYILWFFYVVIACISMVFKANDKEFLRFAWSLIIGMSLAMVICMIYPNGITLRPNSIPDNFLGNIVAGLYVTDTSTNVFPSIHVYNSLAVHIALAKCTAIKKNKPVVLMSLILCILICLSTLFLKQHSIVDVIGAFILMGIMYIALYVIDYSKLRDRVKEIVYN